jgi:hypothetical protein
MREPLWVVPMFPVFGWQPATGDRNTPTLHIVRSRRPPLYISNHSCRHDLRSARPACCRRTPPPQLWPPVYSSRGRPGPCDPPGLLLCHASPDPPLVLVLEGCERVPVRGASPRPRSPSFRIPQDSCAPPLGLRFEDARPEAVAPESWTGKEALSATLCLVRLMWPHAGAA